MLINKYHQSIFYSHNLSSYDVIFIYNVLLNYNESIGFEHYNLKTTMRENKIIRLDIIIYNEKSDYKEYINKTDKKHKLKKKKYIKISFVDSLNFFNSSLEKITKDLNLGFQKGKFPHFFASRNNLNYRGNKPEITYYPNIDTKEYDLIPKEN
jgi:DNA polymerase type B, organellar and viral